MEIGSRRGLNLYLMREVVNAYAILNSFNPFQHNESQETLCMTYVRNHDIHTINGR